MGPPLVELAHLLGAPGTPSWAPTAAMGLGVAGVAAAGFLRRRKNASTAPPDVPTPPSVNGTPPAAKRSIFRRSSSTAPAPGSTPAAPSPVAPPEYFEGPPEPRPSTPSGDPAQGVSSGPPPDLDALLAQLDRLSEQIRRKGPARASKPSSETETPAPPGSP